MRDEISSTLLEILKGKTAFLGIGNTERGDDGFGVALAESLRDAGVEHVLVGGTTPENYLVLLWDGHFDTVVLIDAVLSEGEPGSVVLMEGNKIKSLFPEVSTHRFSLGTLAEIIESEGRTRAWLLGVVPREIETGSELSRNVKETLVILVELITEAKRTVQEGPERNHVWN